MAKSRSTSVLVGRWYAIRNILSIFTSRISCVFFFFLFLLLDQVPVECSVSSQPWQSAVYDHPYLYGICLAVGNLGNVYNVDLTCATSIQHLATTN